MRPDRIDIASSQISCCNAAQALELVERALRDGTGGYVCFVNAHGVVAGRRDRKFRDVTNASLLSVADGKSVFWAGWRKGAKDLGHIPGPDFMLRAMKYFPERRHYLYGSTPEVLAALTQRLRAGTPRLNICGSYSPPFRSNSAEEQQQDLERIRAAGAEFVWVGLGAPKQEFWMSGAYEALRPAVLFGVGAAFDFHAGTLRRAPAMLRRMGLEWLYRLFQEPRRLWRRYLVTNSLFVYYLLQDVLRPASTKVADD